VSTGIETMLETEKLPGDIAVDDTHLYFSEWGNGLPFGRIPLAGGAREELLPLGSPTDLAVDGTYAYFTHLWLMKAPKVGGDAEYLAPELPNDVGQDQIIADGGRIYWVASALRSIHPDGSDPKDLVPART
jgi:hypothetical protein